MELQSKLPDVGTTIFTVMSRMAAEHNAINLSQGYPDFPVPLALLEKLNEYAHRGENQYPPMHGIPYLREQIAAKLHRCYQLQVDAETELTIASGATEALFVAIQAVVSEGDEVIVFDPAYDSYKPAVTLAGGKTRHIPLAGEKFSIDWDRVRQAITPRTRLIIINSPHNPTGAVINRDDLNELAALIDGTRILVLSDEVYEHMIYDGARHHSAASHSSLRNQSFVVSSFYSDQPALGKPGSESPSSGIPHGGIDRRRCHSPRDVQHRFFHGIGKAGGADGWLDSKLDEGDGENAGSHPVREPDH